MSNILKAVFAGLFLIISASNVMAAPITVNGLHWGLSLDEMAEQLQNDGYSCQKFKNPLWTPEAKALPRYIGKACRKDKAEIWLTDNEIHFYCDVFNMCAFSLHDAAQKFIDSGKIDSLTPNFIQGNKRLGTSTHVEICGNGNDGDVACLLPLGSGDNFDVLILKKAAFGKDIGFK